MSGWLILVLLTFATHRVTRLVTRDYIPLVRLPREWIDRKLGSEHWFAYLTQCDWCSGVWVSAALTTGLALYTTNVMHQSWFPWTVWVLVGLSASSLTGLIANMEPEEKSED